MVGNDECLDGLGWAQWLTARRTMFQQKYVLDPDQLVADQRREQSISRDYQGREILELLQNAADAAMASDVPGRVHIELSARNLIVANTGRPFTVGGVKSLQTPDLSPKHSKNSKFIGSKGLGFRSILNWTRHPIILSGQLRLAYNTDYVHELIRTLATNNDQIRTVLGDASITADFPVPLLPFPMHLLDVTNRDYLEDKALLGRCDSLREKGFDTVIGMPFDREHGFANAMKQIDVLRPQFLLFAEGLSELAVTVNDAGDNGDDAWQKTWSTEKLLEHKVVISERDASGEVTSTRWHLYSRTGLIDSDLLQDKEDPDNYHLVVAFQEEGLPEYDNLYSFFPTSIPLPVRALCHASLELERNRKHLQDGPANHFVLARLAEFLAEMIEEQGRIVTDHDVPRRLIAPDQLLKGYQTDIESFESSFIAALKTKKVFPTLGGDLVAADETFSFPEYLDSHDWLPVDSFSHLTLVSDRTEKSFCRLLGVEELDGEQFVGLLKDSTTLTLDNRAALIQGIIDENLGEDYCFKGLLLDAEGSPLSEGDSIYLPGGNLGKGLIFPDWARVKILHEPLWELIRGNRARESAKELSVFGVHEFALGALIAGLVSSANAAVEMQDETTVRSALLSSLYRLYSRYSDPEKRPIFPNNLTAIVLNQSDEWVPAKNAYFGATYSPAGKIMAKLYASSPKKLVAEKAKYAALGIDGEQLFDFLDWLGVEDWPRTVRRRKVEGKFKDYALPKLAYPVIFSESDSHRFENYGELPSTCRFRHVRSLDGIDDILKADSNAILAWLAKDPRASGWLQEDTGNGLLVFVPLGARNDRIYEGNVTSYIHWKIKTSPWLSSVDSKFLAPTDCMVNDAAVSGIFPKPSPPDKEDLEAYSLSSELLRLAWLNAGVRDGVEDLDSEEIYRLLIELPERDHEGKLVGKLYNWLVKSVDFALDESGKNYRKFCKDGKIYSARAEEKGYYPAGEAYHVDVEGFPRELLNTLPVVRLPKKRGAEKVRRLFGINVLDKKAVNEVVVHHHVAACTEVADQHFQQAKKYIEIYRRYQFAKAPGYPLFDALQLLVCDQVQSQITFKGATIDHPLPPSSYSIQRDRLYVCCRAEHANDPCHSLLANTLGDAIASIFGLAEGDSFSKIYQCDEASRAELLARMIGDDLDDDLDAELQRLIEEGSSSAVPEPTVTLGPVPKPPPLKPVATPPLQPVTPGPATPATDPAPTWTVPGSVAVEPMEHKPHVPSARVGIRVNSGGSAGNGGGSDVSPPKSDGKAGESLAMLFEEEQGRFPLYVGHVVGYEAPGADIVSFRNEHDRTLFQSGEDQSASLVERIIESKEKWRGGAVSLSVNEVNAAAQWKDKYFIYRFTPIDAMAAEYQLTILNNPLSDLVAVASSIEISLDASTNAQQVKLVGKIDSRTENE